MSRSDRTGVYREEIAKVCALIEMTLRGTPYIYQGQEIAMGNVNWESIDEINDVQAVNYYKELVEKGKDKNKAFKRAATGTRDNARSPFQWSDSNNAGFTTGKPWLKISSDYRRYNAEDEAQRKDSVLNFFKKAIKLRKNHEALVYGEFVKIDNISKPLYCYYREYENEKYYIELNLSKSVLPRPVETTNYELILSTNDNFTDNLKAFEGKVYKVK